MNRIGDNLVHTGSNKKIVMEFSKNNVEFVLIGGLAVAWYCPDRQADDMDLLVNCTEQNSIKVSKALASILSSPPSENAFAKPDVKIRINHYYYADVMTQAGGGLSYQELLKTSEPANLFNIPISVPSKDSLIILKKHTIEREKGDIQKHKNDIELLMNTCA